MLKKKFLPKNKKQLKLLVTLSKLTTILGLLMVLPACRKRQQPLLVLQVNQHIADPVPLDIPTPVSVQLYEYDSLREGTQIFGFPISPIALSASVRSVSRGDPLFYKDFYNSAMAEVGWQQESCVQGVSEVVFVFKKPRKWCTLVLEPRRVCFYISFRKKK